MQPPQWVAPFEAAARPVSVADFMAFVADGGYENQELWAPEDWKIISDAATGRMCPATWTLTVRLPCKSYRLSQCKHSSLL